MQLIGQLFITSAARVQLYDVTATPQAAHQVRGEPLLTACKWLRDRMVGGTQYC